MEGKSEEQLGGSFIVRFCQQTTVYAYPVPERRWDIGNLESYERVKKEYRGTFVLM